MHMRMKKIIAVCAVIGAMLIAGSSAEARWGNRFYNYRPYYNSYRYSTPYYNSYRYTTPYYWNRPYRYYSNNYYQTAPYGYNYYYYW